MLKVASVTVDNLLLYFVSDGILLLVNVTSSASNYTFKSPLSVITEYFKSTSLPTVDKYNNSPRRCLSASDRLDTFAVKEGMTELMFAPENVKGKGYT